MKKNILFFDPCGSPSNYFYEIGMQYPLLGPLYMATQLHELGYNVTVIKENYVTSDVIESALKNADILILTMLTNYAKRGYEYAQQYKKMRPDGWVIAGGIHVSFLPEEALAYVDQVAVGEGFLIIKDLVDRRIDAKIVTGAPLENLDLLPIPDYSLLANYQKLQRIPIMTSLGCPYDCTFCCVTKMYGRKYRHQGADRIIKELQHHLQFFKTKRIFFYDDNFCANKKNSLALFEKIKENKLKLMWGCQVRADLAKDESFVQKMAEAGCYRVYIGFESINEKTLEDLNKKETLKDIENAIRIFNKYGITIHGMFIVGTDSDTMETFDATIDFCHKNKIDHAQFFSITLLPGTDIFNNLNRSRFAHCDWNIMDGFHVNIIPRNMTSYELISGILHMHTAFYSWKRIFYRFTDDFKFCIRAGNRSLGYKSSTLVFNFLKNVVLHMMIKKWRTDHRRYHEELRGKHDHELKQIRMNMPACTIDNFHANNKPDN